MKIILKKLFLFLGTAFYFPVILLSQNFSSSAVSNYSGISAVAFQPAAIADNRLRFDMTLLDIRGSINNNLGYFNWGQTRSTLLKGAEFPSSEDSLLNVLFRINPGSNRYFFADGSITLMSFMICPKKSNKGFGFSLRERNVFNMNGLRGGDVQQLFDPQSVDFPALKKQRISAKQFSWTEAGISYGRVLIDKDKKLLKAGITGKLLWGLSAAYSTLKTNRQGKVYYLRYGAGYTSEILSPNSIGLDAGISYENRNIPDKDSVNLNDEVKESQYKYKIGASLLDLGGLKFNNELVNFIELEMPDDSTPADPEDPTLFIDPKLLSPSRQARNFRMSPPASLFLQMDYRLYKRFYLNISSLLGFRQKSDMNVHYPTTLYFSPRIEGKHAEIALPAQLNKYGQFDAGIALRLGPLWIGSNTLVTNILRNKIYNVGGYCMLKLYVPKNLPKIKLKTESKEIRDIYVQRYNLTGGKMKQEIQLLKLNIIAPLYGLIELEFERKIIPVISYHTALWFAPPYSFSAVLQGRYYYNLKRRIEKKKTGNGFSANYLAIGTNVYPGYTTYVDVPFLYGIQRRFWKLGYIDVNAGFIVSSFPYYFFDITANFKLGIAIDNLKFWTPRRG